MHIFDELDHQLISLLREDGRAPFSKVASVLGISRATVQTRIDRLLETGAVLGFTLRVRQDYDEQAIRAIMMIEVAGRTTTKVIKFLRGLPELHALHTVPGIWWPKFAPAASAISTGSCARCAISKACSTARQASFSARSEDAGLLFTDTQPWAVTVSHIPQIDYETASDAIREAHDEEIRLRGRMTNMKRTLLHSPTAHRIYAEWFTLREELRPAFDDRAIWLLCHAISQAMHSPIAMGFFRRAFSNAGIDFQSILPSEDEQRLIDFGRAIVADSHKVPASIWDGLKARYDNATLVNFVAFVGIMVATALFNNVVDVEFDPELLPYVDADA